MARTRLHWLALLAAPAFLAGLSGCKPGADRADLVFMNGAEPETLDPAAITGQPEGRIANALFEGLLSFDEAGEPQPGVAARWEISPDGLTYLFHLREEARWSNGDPVTAEDFVGSWRRTLAPETASEYAYQLHYIAGAKAFHAGEHADFTRVGAKALGPRTLEVRLENPTPYFLDLCAFVTLLPVHLPSLARWGDDWMRPGRLVGNGAYVLEAWRLNDRVRLAKNPHYWGRDRVVMRAIDILPSARAGTAFNYYATGRADLMMDKGLVPTALIDDLKRRPDFHAAPFLGTYFIRFNASRKPFSDPRVRLAFALALDRDLLVEKITRAGELPAGSLVPPGTAGYEPPPGPGLDPARARALMAEAGYPGGSGFPLVSYLHKGDSELDRDLAVEIQGMLRRELGVTLDPVGQEWKVYLRSLSSLDYDLCRSSWVGDYRDPNTFLDMFVTGGGNNRTGWGDPAYDDLIAAAAKELEPARRFAHFREAERLLLSEAAAIAPLYFYVGIQFYDPSRLGGIRANLLDEHPLKAMFWKER